MMNQMMEIPLNVYMDSENLIGGIPRSQIMRERDENIYGDGGCFYLMHETKA